MGLTMRPSNPSLNTVSRAMAASRDELAVCGLSGFSSGLRPAAGGPALVLTPVNTMAGAP